MLCQEDSIWPEYLYIEKIGRHGLNQGGDHDPRFDEEKRFDEENSSNWLIGVKQFPLQTVGCWHLATALLKM